jgi:hypothetical protein
VYDGEAVTVPLASGTVLGLLDGVEHPLDGPVAAPCLVRPPGS